MDNGGVRGGKGCVVARVSSSVRVADIGMSYVRNRPAIGNDRPPSCMHSFFFCDWFSSPMPLPISPPIPSPWIPEPTLVLVPFAPRRCSLFLDPKPRGTLPMVDGHLQLVRGKSSSHRRNSFRSSSLRRSPPRSSSSISKTPISSSPKSGPPRSSSPKDNH